MVFYTLSVKYQLQENVRWCKLIRPAVISVGGFIILIIMTECLPILMDFSDELQAWFNLIFDTMAHINALIVVPTIILLMEGFRKVLIQNYKKFVEIFKTKDIRIARENEGDVYFEMFNKSVVPQMPKVPRSVK
ncbi:hypothetical protein L5515_009942 [Caenorhabditis briggsae]|uniref:Uncharacterized protein n=1 Tax=Caenorhabditis briggsae TaxID=6238 RepID=A0AAE9FB80_CAEBR|nr:hypothetical protein L5515_009942 [Caenorhabditis briggsae]